MSDNSKLELIREAANRPPYKQDVYVNAGQLLAEIEREYLPRPRFEDGELVDIGDQFEFDGESFHIRDLHVGLDKKTYIVARDRDGLFDMEPGERVKRPDPEVLDADGVPIRKGDTVWYEGERYRVTDVYMLDGEDPGVDLESFSTVMGEPTETITNAWNKLVTHKQPDSLERIEADARKNPYNYWGCGGASCLNCPAKKDGKKPRERYGTHSCNQAMKLDLLRRQREVLERGR